MKIVFDPYCYNPKGCIEEGHGHCANADCDNPDQEVDPPGYSPYCKECDPRNPHDAQDIFDDIGER